MRSIGLCENDQVAVVMRRWLSLNLKIAKPQLLMLYLSWVSPCKHSLARLGFGLGEAAKNGQFKMERHCESVGEAS